MKSLLPALAFALLAGGAPDDDFRSEQQILRHLTVKLAQYRSGPSEELSASVSTLKSLLDRMTTQSADVKYQDGRVHNYEVTDLDPKSKAQARLERDYDARLKTMLENLDAFVAANTKKFGPQTPEFQEAKRRADEMVKEIERVEAEKKLKVRQAIQTYADAQKEYAVLLERQREVQAALDQSSAEFRSLRGRADTQLHSLEGAMNDLRRAAGSGEQLHSARSPVLVRRSGGDVFDWFRSAAPVNLPDVATPEGVPLGLDPPPAPDRHPDAPPELVANPKVQSQRAEGETLQRRARELEVEKVRLFSAKSTTPEEWTAYSQKVQGVARDIAIKAIVDRGLGGSEEMDLDAMDAKPLKEPPVPGKETP